jgi:hypothetical protein
VELISQQRIEIEMKRSLLKAELEAKMKRVAKNRRQEQKNQLETKAREKHHERLHSISLANRQRQKEA